MRPRLALCAAALLCACSTNEAGKIPCADDSSCPRDYPSCQSGTCTAPTASSTGAVSIIGVVGKQQSDPLRGTVTVLATASAYSGVKSVTLSAGSTTIPSASRSGAVFSFTVDTTQLANGAVTLTATMTPGQAGLQPVTSAAFAITVDNAAPVLTVGALAPAHAVPGQLVTLAVTANEALQSISGTVLQGATKVGTLSIVSSNTTTNAYSLGFAVGPAVAPGAYTISLSATDIAGNTATIATAAKFDVQLTGLTVATPVLSQARLGKFSPNAITISFSTSEVPASDPAVSLSDGTHTHGATLVSGHGSTGYVYSYTAAGDETGTVTITITALDAVGNIGTNNSATMTVDSTRPTVGSIAAAGPSGTTVVAAGQPLTVTFSVNATGPTPVVTLTMPDGTTRTAQFVSVSGANPYDYTYQYGLVSADPKSDATHHGNVSVIAYEAFGNPSSATSATGAFDVDGAPVIGPTTITPWLVGSGNSSAVSVQVTDCSLPASGAVTLSFVDQSSPPGTSPNVTPGTVTAGSCTSAATYPFTLDTSPQTDQHTYDVTITATNKAGVSSTASLQYTIDRVAPAIQSSSWSPSYSNNTSSKPTLTIVANKPLATSTTFQVLDDSGGSTSLTSPAQPCQVCTFSSLTLANGKTYHPKVSTIKDLAGNSGSTYEDSSVTYVADGTRPTFSSGPTAAPNAVNDGTNPGVAFVQSGQTVTITGTASENLSSASVTGLNSTGTPDSATCTVNLTSFSCAIVAGSAAGKRTLTVTLTDLASNTSTATNNAFFSVDDTGPTVTTGPTLSNLTRQITTNTAQVGSVATITFTTADDSGGSGIDPNTVPVVLVGGQAAAVSGTPTHHASGSIVTSIDYTYAYTFNGTETCASSSTTVTVKTYQDVLGNQGATNSSLPIACDLSAPVLSGPGTYNRTPGSAGSMSVTLTVSANNGTTTIYAFGNLADATSAVAGTHTNSIGSASSSTTGTVNITNITNAALPGGVVLKAFDSLGLASNIVVSTSKTQTIGANSGALSAFGTRSVSSAPSAGTKQPALAQLLEYPLTTAINSTFAEEQTGLWESVTTTGTAPTARTQPFAGYDPVARKFVVNGGTQSNGATVPDGNSFVLDVATLAWESSNVANIPVPGGGGGCDAGTTRFSGAIAYDPISQTLVAHGGRCLKTATGGFSNRNQNDYLQLIGYSNGSTWSAISGQTSTDTGTVGSFAWDAFDSGLVHFGYADGNSTQTNKIGVLDTATQVYSDLTPTGLPANRYGLAAVSLDTAAANCKASPAGIGCSVLFAGGFPTPTTVTGGTGFLSLTANSTNQGFVYDGSAFVGTANLPSARAHSAADLEANGNTVLLAGGILQECPTTQGTTAPVQTPGFGCTLTGTQFKDDLQNYDPSADSWHTVALPSGNSLGITSAENGSTFHGFYDSTTNKFFVYRPVAQTITAFEVAKTPRVLVVASNPNDGGSSPSALTISVTTSSPAVVGATAVGTKVSLLNFNTGNWDEQTGLEQSSGGTIALSGGVPTTGSSVKSGVSINSGGSASSWVLNGTVYILVEPATIANNLDTKSVSVANVTVSWTDSTP